MVGSVVGNAWCVCIVVKNDDGGLVKKNDDGGVVKNDDGYAIAMVFDLCVGFVVYDVF